MKYLLLFFCLSFFNFTTAQNETIGDSTITWSENKKLVWADFQGNVDPETYGKALTSYKIEIAPADVMVDENDKIQGFKNLTVKARFYKKQSWSSIVESDTVVLKHEQLHFDIAELFARKIRKEFKSFQDNNEARFSVYSEKYKQLWKACRKFQKEFDFETNHGRDLEYNKIWVEKIKKEFLRFKEL